MQFNALFKKRITITFNLKVLRSGSGRIRIICQIRIRIQSLPTRIRKLDTTFIIQDLDDFASLYSKEVQSVVDYIQ